MLVKFKQTGDTIVEVLIAIAVVSLVLGGAFTVANKSANQVRDAQEHSEAQQYAAEIVERLISLSTANPASYTDTTSADRYFCISTATNKKITIMNQTLPAVSAPPSEYAGECNRPSSAIEYHSIIERNGSFGYNDTFTVYVRWDRLGGGYNEVAYVYRIRS